MKDRPDKAALTQAFIEAELRRDDAATAAAVAIDFFTARRNEQFVKARAAGLSYRQIAEIFGVTHPRVIQVLCVAPATKHQRLRPYGLTQSDFEAMLAAQDNKCAICHREFGESRKTAIDHCHDTGAVRGILCHRCNLGLGVFGDSEGGIATALQYLRDSSTPKVT